MLIVLLSHTKYILYVFVFNLRDYVKKNVIVHMNNKYKLYTDMIFLSIHINQQFQDN